MAALVVALLAGLGLPGLLRAQAPIAPPIEGIPIDPDQLKSQVSQALVRLVLDRPVALALRAHEIALESSELARDLGPRFAAGQGPNEGPVALGLDVEVGQIAAASAECAQRAQRNLRSAAQDLEVLKGVLGGEIDLEAEPGPEGALNIVMWFAGFGSAQRERNATVDECVQESLLGLGRLRAYRSLYPA